jgi:glycosyltransferase involved in cell wall biosynthesis
MNNSKSKVLRITTVAGTMNVILKGQLSYLNQFFDVIGATAKFYNYFEEISQREGIRLYNVNLTRKITPFRDFVALIQLIYIIIKEKPLIVHTQTPKANFIGMLASFICRTPIRILSIVGMPAYKNNGFKGIILSFIDKISYKLSTNIYPNSKGLFDYYSKNESIIKKIGFIGNGSSNGIDFEYYNPKHFDEESLSALRVETGLKKNHFVYSFMGRVVNDKGIKELVDAFLSICDLENFANIRLLIIGPIRESDDPIPLKYQELLKNHPKICFVGLQRDVRPYLMISNVFVFPSYREGLPGSLMQAGAMGIPLIASDIIGNNEIINQGDGILFTVKDSKALSEVMQRIYLNNEMRMNMESTIRNKMLKIYDQKHYWNSLKDEYFKLIEFYKKETI